MGILDDLAMGFGFKEKDRDYYDRTAATISRNQGSDAGDSYKKYVGMTGGPIDPDNNLVGIVSGSSYANAPNYFQKIGPSLSDFRQVPNTGSGANPYDASGNLRPDYKPGSAAQRYKDVGRPQPGTLQHTIVNSPSVLGLLANIFGGYKPIQPQGELRSSYKPQSVNAAPAGAPAPAATKDYGGYTPEPVETSILTPIRNEMSSFGFSPATSGQTSDPLYMPGGEFDAFMQNVGSLPAFDKFRDSPAKMRAAFEAYRKAVQAQGGAK